MEASDAADREVMTWAGFGEASRVLARQVADSGSLIDCEYVFKRVDKWINFPWSTEDPIWAPQSLHSGQTAVR